MRNINVIDTGSLKREDGSGETTQHQTVSWLGDYPKQEINSKEQASGLERAVALHRAAYINRDKVKVLLRQAQEAMDAAQDMLLQEIEDLGAMEETEKGEEYKDNDVHVLIYSVEGRIDWKWFQKDNPHVDVERYRSKDGERTKVTHKLKG